MIYLQKFLHELSKMYLFTFSWIYFFLSTILLFSLIPIILPGIEPVINEMNERFNVNNLANGTINPVISITLSIILIILSIPLRIFGMIGFFVLTFAGIAGLGPLDLTHKVIGMSFSGTPNPTLEEIIIFSALVLLSFIFSLIAIKFLRNKNYSLKFLLFWIMLSFISVLIFYNNYQYMNHVDVLNRTDGSQNYIYLLTMLAHSTMMTICAFYLYVTRNNPWKDSMDSYSIFKPFSSPKNLE